MERKGLIAFAFTVIFSITSVKSQEVSFKEISRDPFNFLVLIDGKLTFVFGEVYFFKDSVRYTFLFEGTYGRIKLSMLSQKKLEQMISWNNGCFHGIKIDYDNVKLLTMNDFSIFDSIPDTTSIFVNIVYAEQIDEWEYKDYFCSFNTDVVSFLDYNILLITNFNKKKSIYYVHPLYKGAKLRSLIWKKEYGNKCRFERKVFAGIADPPKGICQYCKQNKFKKHKSRR